jgi:hypothetical protein
MLCRWNMGCCIPVSLSGENDWFASRQSHLKALSLVTDGTCYDECQDFCGLFSLKHLRSFSWRGFDEKDRRIRAVLRQILRLNAGHLEVLELEPLSDDSLEDNLAITDVISLSETNPYDELILFFKADALQRACIPNLTAVVNFPSFRDLSLTRMSLDSSWRKLATIICFEKLRSLAIRLCVGDLLFLSELASSSQILNIRSFEIVEHGLLAPNNGRRTSIRSPNSWNRSRVSKSFISQFQPTMFSLFFKQSLSTGRF